LEQVVQVELLADLVIPAKIRYLQKALEVELSLHKLHMVVAEETFLRLAQLALQVACMEVMQLEQPLPGKEILVEVDMEIILVIVSGRVVEAEAAGALEVQAQTQLVEMVEVEPPGSLISQQQSRKISR